MNFVGNELVISTPARKFYYDSKGKSFLKIVGTEDLDYLCDATSILKNTNVQNILLPTALFFMDNKEVGIVFNMTSVDLHTYKNKHDMSIQDIAFTSLGILNGIDELHSNGLIHCDIKLENVVVCKETHQPKIIDLDFATRNDPISRLLDEESFGTNGLIAPEMIKRKWNNSIDFFGFGHLLKELCHKDKRAIGVFRTVYESLLKENPEERSCFQNQEFIVQPVIDQIKSALKDSPPPQQYSREFIEQIFKLKEDTKTETVDIKLL